MHLINQVKGRLLKNVSFLFGFRYLSFTLKFPLAVFCIDLNSFTNLWDIIKNYEHK